MVGASLFASDALAQCPAQVVESMAVTTASQPPAPRSVNQIDIRLASAGVPTRRGTNQSIPPELIVITRQPSGAAAPAGVVKQAVMLEDEGYQRLVIDVQPALTVDPAADQELEVTIGPILLECGSTLVRGRGIIIDTPEEEKGRLQLTQAELEKATAYATPVDQKNFYAAIAAVKGDGASGAGAADVLIDQTIFKAGREVGALFDNAAIKFMLKKSTGGNADPRSQLTGVEFTKALLWGAANRARKGLPLDAAERMALRDRAGIVRGVVVHEFTRLEGDAFDFNAVNFISDTQLTMPSIAMRLGSRGFWNFRIVGGTELGQSKRQPDAGTTPEVTSSTVSDYVVRSKVGADLTLRWGRATSDPTRFAVEVDLGHVSRMLHRAESALEDVVQDGKTVQNRVTIEKGTRRWSQANLKVFLFGTDTARYGVQLTYFDGRLPPLFARASGFQFGMVIEQSPVETSPGR
jgi:hypothetical protein